jgi:hypothetical protein
MIGNNVSNFIMHHFSLTSLVSLYNQVNVVKFFIKRKKSKLKMKRNPNAFDTVFLKIIQSENNTKFWPIIMNRKLCL